MRSLLLSFVAALATVSPSLASPTKNYGDAPLRAVKFIDANEGWSVGDDGAIWHTIDGGEAWERQHSGVSGSLRDLHFLTPYLGWVVGREELPDGGSAGIVLTTTDGGLKWSRIAINMLPGLHAVKFFDQQRGIAAGDATDRFSSGVYSTSDGGRSWTILPGPRQAGWLAADFSAPNAGALAGSWSNLAILRDSVFGKSEIEMLGGRNILGLKLYRDSAFAVGQGGLLLKSLDTAGGKWKNASPQILAGDALTNCDFHAVHVFGEHVWVVGSPGTFVLHSRDYGSSWEIAYTGQSLPLHSVYFLDVNSGWAVGDLGTILATTDGGKNWKIQRRGGERAAVLFIHAGPRTLPLDAMTQLGADDGYLIAALRVISADPTTAPIKRASDPQRWSQAVRSAGGAVGASMWQFPLQSAQASLGAKELLTTFDPLHGNRAGEMMLRHLVLALRMWQPDVVVCDDALDGQTTLCGEAVKEAFERAADPKWNPEQIDKLGLKPWSAKKLYATSDCRSNRRHVLRFVTTEPMNRFGESAQELASRAAELLGETVEIPAERGYTLRASTIAGASEHLNVMDGTTLAHAGTARRPQVAMTPDQIPGLEEQAKLMQTKRNILALARSDLKGLGGADQLMGQLSSMLKDMPIDEGGRTLYAVARSQVQSGQWQLAREAFELMIKRYPGHPLTVQAYRWLAAYSSSSEARRRFELGQFVATSDYHIQQSGFEQSQDPRFRQSTGIERNSDEVRKTISNPEVQAWYARTLGLEAKLAECGPLFVHDPAFQFCLQSARRSLGNDEQARKWYSKFVAEAAGGTKSSSDPWREAAATELWLINQNGIQTRPTAYCQLTSARPYLDGKLDDECWKDAKPMILRNVGNGPGSEYSAKAMFAFDKEFLYIAVQCHHPVGKQVPRVEKRRRDEDLHAYDRVGIMLNLDRNYQTYYHFQIDQRGCLSEDCWGDKTWNPKWYVALNSDETGWTTEAAIPLVELTGESINIGRLWSCNVVRVVPGAGVQAWSLPADVDPRPEGMGLLMFHNERK
jgi:photosystem II stability/assembly factor-like uncharacterized protein